jgi:predicted transcriptional regulator
LRKANSLARGYAYEYSAISKTELKKAIVKDVREWCNIVEEKLA